MGVELGVKDVVRVSHHAGVDSGNSGRRPSLITVWTSLVGVEEKLEKAGTPGRKPHVAHMQAGTHR